VEGCGWCTLVVALVGRPYSYFLLLWNSVCAELARAHYVTGGERSGGRDLGGNAQLRLRLFSWGSPHSIYSTQVVNSPYRLKRSVVSMGTTAIELHSRVFMSSRRLLFTNRWARAHWQRSCRRAHIWGSGDSLLPTRCLLRMTGISRCQLC
jgi:hypothetical protein